VLCLAPTRELARQDADEFKRCTAHLGMDTVLVYGGVSISAQENALWRGADIVVGTPGRINDLIEREALVLTALRHSILDEADEMLSIGFAEDVEKILSKAPTGDAAPQTLLFSATMPDWVQKVCFFPSPSFGGFVAPRSTHKQLLPFRSQLSFCARSM